MVSRSIHMFFCNFFYYWNIIHTTQNSPFSNVLNSVVFSVFTTLYIHHYSLIPKHFSCSRGKPNTYQTPNFLLPLTLARFIDAIAHSSSSTPFCGQMFHYENIVCPFIRQWTLQLCLLFTYCKWGFCEYSCISFCVNICFQFSWLLLWSECPQNSCVET
jgi:hypothetical protein